MLNRANPSWEACPPFDRPAPRGIWARRRRYDRRVRNILLAAYLIAGVLVASDHTYYSDLDSVSRLLSAAVATALWPLVLAGADLHLNL